MSAFLDYRSSARPISYCLCAVLLASCLRAQNSPDSSSLTIRSDVRLVQIDVIAKDKHGNPVSGLEAKDFTLMDDGAPQKISRVTVEHGKEENTSQQIGVPDAPARPVQPVFSNAHPDNVVPTVILFDVLNTSIEDQASMRKGLLQSLNRLKDGTPIALLILGDDLTVVSDFTTSSISLTKVAETGFHPRMEGFGPALTSRKTGNPVADAMIRKVTAKAFRIEEHDRMTRTLLALKIISERLGQMRGRKSLLWVTGGLSTPDGYVPVQEAIDRLNDVNVAVYTVDARGVVLGPEDSASVDQNDLIADIKAEHEEIRGDILSVVAAATGGVSYRNMNRLDVPISQAIADRSLVYELEYYPRHGVWNGKLHKLQVKTSRPGVRLRYRASYRATLPARPNAQEQQQILAELASSPLDYAGMHFNVQVLPGPASDPRFVLHVPADEVQWSPQEGKMGALLEIWFIQKRATGDDVSTKTSRANLQLTLAEYQSALSKGVSLATDLKLEASAEKVRVMVRDENSGKIGSVDVPVNMKDMAQHIH